MKALILIIVLSLPLGAGKKSEPVQPERTVIATAQPRDGKPLSIRELRTLRLRNSYFDFVPQVNAFESKNGSLYYCDSLILAAQPNITYGNVPSRNEFNCESGIIAGVLEPEKTDKFGNPCCKWAFYEKDESAVRDFPLLDIKNNKFELIKYPMNGEPSEKLRVGIYDPSKESICYLQVSDFSSERYLTNVCFGGPNLVYVQVLDREQHNMHLNVYDATNGSLIKTVLTEHNDSWVEPYAPLEFINPYTFIYQTDNRDGYKNLYLANISGRVKRIAKMNADMHFVEYSGNTVYFTANAPSPIQQNLYSVDITNPENILKASFAKPRRITPKDGWNVIRHIRGTESISVFNSSFAFPGESCTFDIGTQSLTPSIPESDALESFCLPRTELGYVPSACGKFRNYYRLFYPCGFDPSKQYPLIVYVYGGPHSQMVHDSYFGNVRLWELYMAQKGYIVYVQDNRGTSCQGADYEKAINRQCGKAELADQMAGIQTLLREPWVDKSRVGVHGWSYGGFMTLTMAAEYPEVFKVAVAGGPVIDWRWYEVMYGERYMDNPATNPDGFESAALTDKASNIKAKTLIFQGADDHTCLWQHSLSFVQKCIDAGVDVEYFPFPRADHNMVGKERDYLYSKISEYFIRNL